MKLIRLAILVGLITAVPICAMIYIGVDRLEKSAPEMRELRDMVVGGDFADPLGPEPDVFPIDRQIANQDDVSLDVIIYGKGDRDLFFFSHKHNRSFRYPIELLGKSDQRFAEKLPVYLPSNDGYPVIRRLTNRAGQSKLCLIEGRTAFDVIFRLVDEDREFVYPINRLSDDDRQFVFGLSVNR